MQPAILEHRISRGPTNRAVVQGQSPSTSSKTTRLHRVFRKRDGISLVISNVVGTGIFTTPALVAAMVPNPVAMLGLWLVGGALALAGAASYARLARVWPQAGGEYVYLSRMYGPLAGFLSGWTSLVAGFSGSIAASAVAVVLFAQPYMPCMNCDKVIASLTFASFTWTFTTGKLVAASLVAFFGLLHALSLSYGKLAQNALAWAVVAFIVVLVTFGVLSGNGSWSHLRSSAAPQGLMSWGLALVPVMFTYSGWNAAAYVSEELYASRRSIRPVLIGGTAIVIFLYVALNALYVYALPAQVLPSSTNAASAATASLFGGGSKVIALALLVALLGNISAMTIAGPRVYFSMARDGVFSSRFARTSNRFKTPVWAIFLQTSWAVALVLLGGFEQILVYTGFAIVLSSGAAVAGLFLPRQRHGELAIPWTKLLVPGAFVLASAAMVINTMLSAPGTSLVGVVLILAGLPFYFLRRHRDATGLTLAPEHAAGD